jgi:hypothetical protein
VNGAAEIAATCSAELQVSSSGWRSLPHRWALEGGAHVRYPTIGSRGSRPDRRAARWYMSCCERHQRRRCRLPSGAAAADIGDRADAECALSLAFLSAQAMNGSEFGGRSLRVTSTSGVSARADRHEVARGRSEIDEATAAACGMWPIIAWAVGARVGSQFRWSAAPVTTSLMNG